MFARGMPEVLVVGAGPTGLCAALILARRRIRLQVIDRAWRTAAHSYALALHAQSLRVLQKLGLLNTVLRNAIPISGIGLYDGPVRKAELRVPNDGDVPTLVVLPQSELERLLEDALEDCGTPVRWNHELSRLATEADLPVATIDKLEKESMGYAVAHTEWVVARSTTLQAPFVIGADGWQSQVRQGSGIEFPETAPGRHFAMFEFRSDFARRDEVHIVFGNATVGALWPLPDGRYRWTFELPEGEGPGDDRSKARLALPMAETECRDLDDDSLRRLVAQRAPWFTGSIEPGGWRTSLRFENRLASAFARGRVGLAGDAAHLAAPIAMHGLNAGLTEAGELATAMADLIQFGGPSSGLEGYGRQAMARWKDAMAPAGPLRSSGKDSWVRGREQLVMASLPASRPDLLALARQLEFQPG